MDAPWIKRCKTGSTHFSLSAFQKERREGRVRPGASLGNSLWDHMFGERRAPTSAAVTPSQPDANQWFDVPEMWEYVRKNRHAVPGDLLIMELTRSGLDPSRAAAETARFFDFSPGHFQGMSGEEAWNRVLTPFLRSLEVSMNAGRPSDVGGRMEFGVENGALVVVHGE